MSFGTEEVAFILYNNRSIEGVVSNFLPKLPINFLMLPMIESVFASCNNLYDEARTIEISRNELNLECSDITYGPDDLEMCTDLVSSSFGKLCNPDTNDVRRDREWLASRGITESIIRRNFLGSLSYIVENATPRQLDVLGITCHPMLTSLLNDDLSGGGIVIPLYENGKLVNVTIRRISDVGKLKYTQSCPDMYVWGIEEISPDHPVWMVEGLLDMMAVNESVSPYSSMHVKQAVSVSSAMWSVPQLMQLMDKAGTRINIFADNDKVGLRTAAVMQEFLCMNGFTVRTYISNVAKDPAEHFLERGLGWEDVVEIQITADMIGSKEDMNFNFLKYLKNRKF